MQPLSTVMRSMQDIKKPFETLDLSFTLRTTMVANNLSVSEMAEIAGVSKSAMEKYLAGPSSPKAVAIASISKALGISTDTLIFGELDGNIENAYQHAFRAFAELIKALKSDPEFSDLFAHFEYGSDEFSDFVRNVAFDHASKFKHSLRSEKLDTNRRISAL